MNVELGSVGTVLQTNLAGNIEENAILTSVSISEKYKDDDINVTLQIILYTFTQIYLVCQV